MFVKINTDKIRETIKSGNKAYFISLEKWGSSDPKDNPSLEDKLLLVDVIRVANLLDATMQAAVDNFIEREKDGADPAKRPTISKDFKTAF